MNMGFEDLESRLKQILGQTPASSEVGVFKSELKERVLKSYQQSNVPYQWFGWRLWLARTISVSTLGALFLGALGVVDAPFLGNRVVGQIQTESGVVEIIRGDESLLVSGTTEVQVGDWVRVGHNGQASLTTDYSVSEIESSSRLKLERAGRIFLDKGRINNTASAEAHIKTDRGLVKNPFGSAVAVEVSETGETRVLPRHQNVTVYDLNEGKVSAEPGEKVVLRSDTVLTSSEVIPEGLNLSKSQIEAILGRLVIARTKALTGIENMLNGKRSQANQEIISAEQSFRSVVQILDSSRDMAVKRQLNLDSVTVASVYPALQAKTDRLDILTEAYALEQLFAVLKQNRNSLAFAPVETEVAAFNRYVLLRYLASVANQEQAAALNTLAENYVVSVLRKVQQSPVRMEQLAYLNAQVEALPRNYDAETFLRALESHLSPDLALALAEKIEMAF